MLEWGMEAQSFLRHPQVDPITQGQGPPATDTTPSLQAMGAAFWLGFQGGGKS